MRSLAASTLPYCLIACINAFINKTNKYIQKTLQNNPWVATNRMINLKTKLNMKSVKIKQVILLSILLGFIVSGCSSFKGMFSKGQDDLKKAESCWDRGQQLEALVYGTNAAIIDPEFIQGKNFLKDRFDTAISNAEKRLAELKGQTNSSSAEEQYQIYNNLVKIYANLSKIKLPISHPKGKWSWTTEIRDYTKQLADARLMAFNSLMREGQEALDKKSITEAQQKYHNAISNYLQSNEQQDSTKKVVFNKFCSLGNSLSTTQNIEDAIIGHSAFKSALTFIKGDQQAQSGVEKMAKHISALYNNQGQKQEKKGTAEDYIAAVELYNKALEWDSTNTEAQNNLSATKEKLAELYYQKGLKAQDAKNSNELAISMFEEARKWIPNYKDCVQRIYNIKISDKLVLLAKNLDVTTAEFGKLQNRIGGVSSVVDKSVDVMDKVTYISDKTRSINETMKNTSTTLKVFNVIPTVGTATGMLARSVDLVQEPVGKVAHKFTMIEQPVITPTKNVVGKSKEIVDNVKGKMETTANIISTTREYTLKLKECIAHVTEEANFKEAEQAIDEINKGLVNTNNALIDINNGFAKIESGTKQIANLSGVVGKVADGIKDVNSVIGKIQPIVKELNQVLDKSFTLNILVKKYTFSVKKILTGLPSEVKAIMGKFSELAMGVVKPVLKKFDIKIPSIPGLDHLSNELDKMKDTYNVLNSEVDKLKNTATEYANYQKHISNNITKLENAVGCKIGQNN